MSRYVAFLRGINVGGHKQVKMDDLRKAFEALGFQNVKTVLASGNVVFEATTATPRSLARTIEGKLEAAFGHKTSVLIRRADQLQKLANARPFGKIKVTPQTRLYVTFLSEKPKCGLKSPYVSPDQSFAIPHISTSEVLTLSPTGRTVDLMEFLEKIFGRNITTRNWNTISRILEGG